MPDGKTRLMPSHMKKKGESEGQSMNLILCVFYMVGLFSAALCVILAVLCVKSFLLH